MYPTDNDWKYIIHSTTPQTLLASNVVGFNSTHNYSNSYNLGHARGNNRDNDPSTLETVYILSID